MKNLILNTDSYKHSHYLQYPPNTTKICSYVESRGGEYNKTLFFGLQAFIKEYLLVKITKEMVDEAETFIDEHIGKGIFNREDWMYIVNKYDGKLPLEIKAVKEGNIIPVKNVLLTIENTDPRCYWLTSFIETAMLRGIWYPTTVATISWHIKQDILKNLEKTCDNPNNIKFKLHDFGARGVSSLESAGLGGMAHLINFSGTDTIEGVLAAKKYYNSTMAGFSIPASEHSSITSWTKEGELDAYQNMLNKFGNYHAVAIVSDSYNIFEAVEKIWGETLKQTVLDSNACIIIRPDSGDPTTIIMTLLNTLKHKFGYTINNKGYYVINKVRLIQGDGVDRMSINKIMNAMIEQKFSIDNVNFGMGGALLQKLNRDTQKFAMKASYGIINGKEVDIYKNPISDINKKSKKGKLMLYKRNGEYVTDRYNEWEQPQLHLVYYNGILYNELQFDDIKNNANTN